MRRGKHGLPRWFVRSVVAVILLMGACDAALGAQPLLRGVWMHANYIKTRAEADQCLDKLDRANFNAVFLLVWYWGGQAAFQTPLCPLLEGVAPGYDPLQYMAAECHRRGIELHAWFVNGAYGSKTVRAVLDRHPDWTVVGGHPDRPWYDLGKPAVRKFQSDLMIGALAKYDLDGIHFDFIRYDGSAVCSCPHCRKEFTARTGFEPIEPPHGKAFPLAYTLAGNPVAKPTTARVLAQFSDGVPAIAVNELGKGRVLLLNWHAARPLLEPVAETLTRTLQQWNAPRDKVFVIDTAPNRERYGVKGTAEAAAALEKLGYHAQIATEDRLGRLAPGSLVVLADVYVIPDDVASSLEQFVRAGGLLVVIDGPVHSMRGAAMQRVLGMSRAGRFLNRLEVIQPVGQSELVVAGGAAIDLAREKLRGQKWAEYRKAGVTDLVRDVYRRAKSLKPNAQVTAAVFTPLASAESAFQDWPGWIREGIIDYVIPMAYTPKDDVLAGMLREWATVDPRLERIIPGLGVFTKVKDDACYAPRAVDAIFSQYRLCTEHKVRGTSFYSLDGTSDHPVLLLTEPLIEALRSGPFQGKVLAYRPASR